MTDQPSTELEVVSEGHLSERMKYAQALAAADLLPASYRRKPANVLLAMEYGHALGLDTVTAIQSVHVIEGKPSASAQLIGALVRRAGHRLRVTGNENHAVAEVVRRDDPEFVFRSEWTMERARAANLTNKSVWKQYPAAMLKARAITEVARDACPEALAGVAYTPEELDDSGEWHVSEPATDFQEMPVSADGGNKQLPETTSPSELDAWNAPSAPAAEVIEAEEVPLASEAQLRAIAAILKKCGVTDRDKRHQVVADIIGRHIDSADELTKSEAHNVIDTLGSLADQDNPEQALTDWLSK